MHASLVRRQLSGLVPPKIATPKLVVSEACYQQSWMLAHFSSALSFSSVRRVWCRAWATCQLLLETSKRPCNTSCERYQRPLLCWICRVGQANCRSHRWALRHWLHHRLQQCVVILRLLARIFCLHSICSASQYVHFYFSLGMPN